ncbi:MAG: BspA family leucine-rich repeat surface protein [Actinobacteria bacterium]|nr:BspA family leucine-rich repeat surface protein [Actinomycetota bacterium]
MSSPPYIDTTPLFTASLTGGGTGSLATASLSNGSLANMIVYNGGTGYPPIASQYLITMSFSNGGGQDAAAYVSSISAPGVILTVTPFYSIQDVIIADGGGPYSTAPTLTFSTPLDNPTWRPRVTATGTATITNGRVTGVTITTSGSNYTLASFPTITVTGGGLAATGTHAVLVPVLRNGRGYTSNPTLTITSPTGTGAVISSSLIAGIGSIGVTAGGGGYTTPPTVRIQGAAPQDTSAAAALSGNTVSTISVTSGSSRFSTAPSINISGGLPPLPAVSNNQIVAWCSVYDNNSNFVGLQISTNGGGGYTVNWGDGTSNNYNSAATGSKQYTTASFAALTSSIYSVTDLYKPALITVTLSGSATSFSTVNFTTRPTLPTGSLTNGISNGWKSIKMAGDQVSGLTLGQSAGSWLSLKQLETFEYSGSNKITTFSSTFLNCTSLVEVVSLYTTSGSSFTNTFQYCYSLQKLPPLDFTNVINASTTFSNCFNLKTITLLNSQTVQSWVNTFQQCYTLQSINATFSSNANNYGGTFNSCYSLKTHPPLNVSNNTNFGGTWQNCYSLKQVKFIGTTSKVTSFFAAFNNCTQLESLPSTMDLSACTSMFATFSGCVILKTSPIFTNTRNLTSISQMFSTCRRLIDIPWFDTINVTDASSLFNACTSLTSIPKLNFARNTNFSSMFNSCVNLVSIPPLETSNGTNFSVMFSNSGIKEPPFFNTSKATNISQMFQSCVNLLKVPAYDFTSATFALSMFSGCPSLTTIPFFDLSKCTNLDTMFQSCTSLKSVPYLNLSSTTSVNSMFSNCTSLTDVGGFDTSRVTTFTSFFANCTSLKSIPLIDTSRGTTFTSMFSSALIYEIPALNMTSSISIAALGGGNLTRMRATGMNASFDVSNNSLDSTALNEIYTNASATGAGKTITVTGNWGAANDTPSIATAKGWAVTG